MELGHDLAQPGERFARFEPLFQPLDLAVQTLHVR